MKKKVRVSPTIPFYTTEPAVSRKLIASTQPTPSPVVGSKTNKVVDRNPAKLSGAAGFTSKRGPHVKPSKISVPAIGAKQPVQGKLRVSGNKSSHQLGFKSKI